MFQMDSSTQRITSQVLTNYKFLTPNAISIHSLRVCEFWKYSWMRLFFTINRSSLSLFHKPDARLPRRILKPIDRLNAINPVTWLQYSRIFFKLSYLLKGDRDRHVLSMTTVSFVLLDELNLNTNVRVVLTNDDKRKYRPKHFSPCSLFKKYTSNLNKTKAMATLPRKYELSTIYAAAFKPLYWVLEMYITKAWAVHNRSIASTIHELNKSPSRIQ